MDEILLRDFLNETSPTVPLNGPNCFSLLYKWIAGFLLLGTVAKIKRKWVTSCFHCSKISECNHAQESHRSTSIVFIFFVILARPWFVEIQQRDVTTSPVH